MSNDGISGAGRDFNEVVKKFNLDLSPALAGMSRVPANDSEYTGVTAEDFFRACQDGERTNHLTRISGFLIGSGMNKAAATQFCLGWNARNNPPLADGKVVKTVGSIASTHQRKHPSVEDPDTPLFDLQAASIGRFFGKDVKPRDWVLNDCIAKGTAGMLVSPGGAGKSQLLLQLAFDVATGHKYFSPWAPSKPGQVVIISAEDDEDELHRRCDRLLRNMGSDPDAGPRLHLLRENLYIVARVGENNLLTQEQDGKILPTALVERTYQTVAQLPDVRLIILDPISRFRGGEENSAEHSTRFVEAIELLAKQTGAAVLCAHHANKASMQGSEQTQAAARGSSALTDGFRLQINLSPPSQNEAKLLPDVLPGKYLVVKITKTNYSRSGIPLFLRRTDEGILFPVEQEVVMAVADEALLDQLVTTVQNEAAAGRDHSMSSFSQRHGGGGGPFRCGRSKLAGLIKQAIDAGRLEVVPGKAKLLRVPGSSGGDATPGTA